MRTTQRTTLMNAALAAADRGWHVFPVIPGDKRPALHGQNACPGTGPCADGHATWETRATTDPERIQRAWVKPYNIGLAAGPSGLVVIDLDTAKPADVKPQPLQGIAGIGDGADVLAFVCEQAGEPMPLDTYTVATPSGGTHLYYRHPADSPALRNTGGDRGNGLGWKIDTRAHGGYVLATGSTIAGRAYRVVHDVPPAQLPGWLAERLTPKPIPTGPVVIDLSTGRGNRYVQAAIQAEVARVTTATNNRNYALLFAATALGQLVAGGALDPDHVRAILTQAARAAGLDEHEIPKTIESGLRYGTARPRTIPGGEDIARHAGRRAA